MRIKLLSYNIQAGVDTKAYVDYITGSWQHLLPTRRRRQNLERTARLLRDYDIVALQEIDTGSLRSGFINQVEYLADAAQFDFWHHQINRDFGRIAQYGNGLLSRVSPEHIVDHKLPGVLPGRGAIAVQFGTGQNAVLLIIVHLALGERSRRRQVSYIADIAADYRHILLVGDMNCSFHQLNRHSMLRALNVHPVHHEHTFPSWRPMRCIDHILVTPSIQINRVDVLKHQCSDHLPVAVDLTLPVGTHSSEKGGYRL